LKPILLILPSGYVLNAAGPFAANGTNNDSSIMKLLLMENERSSYADENDRFIVDRGFQNSKGQMENECYGVFMPSLLKNKHSSLCFPGNVTFYP